MALPPIIEYDAYMISPGTDLEVLGRGTPTVTGRYGDYGGVNEEITLRARCELSVTYTDVNWTINGDNSVTVTGNISVSPLTRDASGLPISSNRQELTAWFNDQEVFHQIVGTSESGSWNLNFPSSFSVTVPPSYDPQKAYPAAIHFRNHNTGTTRPADEFALGILITNPNPPDYRPGATLDGNWKSHNRTGGKAHILNGTWHEMRTSNGLVGNDNPPSIRVSDHWTNQRNIGQQ